MLKEIYQKIFSLEKRERIFFYRAFLSKIICGRYFIHFFRLRKLKNKYKGKKCFIFGNGPSLNKMELELFKHEYTWGANRGHFLYDKVSWRHKFFVRVDNRGFDDISVETQKMIHEQPETTFFFPYSFLEESLIEPAANVYLYNEATRSTTSNYNAVSFNIPVWMPNVWTVTVAAILLAIYLGFKDIYLVGCDTSYIIPDSAILEADNPNELISTDDNDENHFDKRYLGKGIKWYHPHVERMIANYEQVKEACEKRNVRIYNATVGGNLEVFPRVDYREALSRK